MVLRPDYRILVVRDVDCYAGVGAGEALTQAHESVAASSGYALYAEAVQTLVAVSVRVEIWDAQPVRDPADEAWHGPIFLELDCPSGHLLAGDDMGHAIDEIRPPQGPGHYRIAFYHHGREEALRREGQVLAAMGRGAGSEEIDGLCVRWEGTERYLFRLWWLRALPEDTDDEAWG